MISYVLLALFGASCLWLTADGLKRRGGIFEFSFLGGCGLFGFLFAQGVGVVSNAGMAPEAGVCKALIMSTLCAAALYFGWKMPLPKQPVNPFRLPFSMKWMYRIGVACIIVGTYGSIKLAGLFGGVLAVNAAPSRHAVVFRGLPVLYVFLSVYSYLGLILVTLTALRLRSWLHAAPAALPILHSLGDIVLAGRRTEFVLLGLILGCVLYFSRRVAPPRMLAVVLVSLAMLAMFLAPAYRSRTTARRWGQLGQISVSETMQRVFSGTEGEFWTEAYLMEVADTQGLYQFGMGFYNTFVKYFVPKLIVGEEFKQKLFVDVPTALTAPNRFGWTVPYGMVPTGPFSVFEQFWYFGAACFFFLARWMKRLWIRALAGDFWSQVIYSVTLTYAVAAVTTDFFSIYNPLFMFILPVTALTAITGSMRLMAEPYAGAPIPTR